MSLAVGDVGGVVAGGGIPADGEGLAGQAERDGAFDGEFEPVAGLADAEDLFGVGDHDFHRPAGGVAFDDLAGCGGGVGGDQGEVVGACPGGLVADQDDGDRAGAEHAVPEATDGRDVHGGVLAVAEYVDGGEGRGGGELGQGAEPVAFEAGPASFPGAWRGEVEQGGVLAEPGRPGDRGGQGA